MRRPPHRRKSTRTVDFRPRLEVVEDRVLLSIVARPATGVVNTTTAQTQDFPDVAVDANGDSVVAWVDFSNGSSPQYQLDIRAQRYGPTGSPVHKDGTTAGAQEFVVNSVQGQYLQGETPSVAMDPNGDFVVAWVHTDVTVIGAYTNEIQARVFNAAGVAQTGDIHVSANDVKNRSQPSVAMDNSGNWVVTWSDQGSGAVNNNDIFARKYSLTGTALNLNGTPTALQVNTGTAATGNQLDPAVAVDASGNFVVSWTSLVTGDGLGQESFAQRFNSSGVAQGSLIHVNTATAGNQGATEVAMTPTGDFIIAYGSEASDSSTADIFYKRYNADGSLRNNAELQANATTANLQRSPDVDIDANGNATIVWHTVTSGSSTNLGISYRRINAQGLPIESSDTLVSPVAGTAQDQEAVAVDDQGDVAIVYEQNSSGYDIRAQFFKYVNDAPTLNTPSNLSINQNASQQTVNLAGITAGGPAGASNPESQTLAVSASSSNPGLIPNPTVNYTSPNATGSIAFTPGSGQSGTATITLTVTDNGGTANSGVNQVVKTFTVTVVGAPTANAQSVTVSHDTAKAITLTGSDPNSPPRSLTYAIATNPTHGSLSGFNASTGAVTYTPTDGYNGADSFTFTDNNGSLTSAPATVTLTVGAATPTANAQAVSVSHNTAKAITLTGADGNDSPALPLTYAIGTNPAHGTISGFNASTGAVTYTPSAGYHGADSFTFTTSNGTNTSSAATVTLSVAVGTPTAGNQGVSTAQNTAVGITLAANDDDIPALTLTFTISPSPQHGTLSGTAPNLTYTPNAGYSGPDGFQYTVSNGTNTSTTGFISITVIAVNHAPTANNQSVTTNQDTPVGVTLTATDPDVGDTLTYSVAANPAHGTLSGTAPNLTYTPTAGYFGADSFTFKATDNHNADSNVATVSITVVGKPTAIAQSVTVSHDTAKGITLTGSDPNSPAKPLTFAIATNPAHGTLSGFNASTGAVTYTPSTGYNGTDSFTFTDNNGSLTSAPATVTLNVAAATPAANAQSVSVSHNTAKAITLTGNDGNDSPALPLTYAIGTNPAHGTLSGLNASTGAVTYTPSAGYHGADSFTFTTSNGTNTSSAATVTLNVAVGTPVANAQSVSTNKNTAVAITLTAVDDDNPALSLTYAVTTAPSHGSLSGTAPNLTYTPTSGYFGPDSFQFTASNGTNTSVAAQVSITVNNVNIAPTLNQPPNLTINENAPQQSVNLTGISAGGSESQTLTVTSTSNNPGLIPNPTVNYTSPNATGSLTFTPVSGQFGTATITVTVMDNGGTANGGVDQVVKTFTVTVVGTPAANNQSVSTNQNTAVAITLTGSDPNTPPRSLTYTVTSNPSNGTLSGTAPNLTYTPNSGYFGPDSFTFKDNNGSLDSNVATVSITVNQVVVVQAPVVTANPTSQTVNAGQTATFTASASGTPTPTVQWQVSTNGGASFSDIPGATSTTLSFTATAGQNGNEYRAVFTNTAGTATTTAATLTVQQVSSTITATSALFGTTGVAALQTAPDSLRLLPSGRNTDLPWLGINRIQITLDHPATLTAPDVSVTGINVANYGPVTISGSGTSYTITFSQAINAADRVTLTIGNASITTFTRRLDVLPGDVNDDGVVNANDSGAIRNVILGIAPPNSFDDLNGDGVVDMTDYNIARTRATTKLP